MFGVAESRHQKHTHILSSKVYRFRHDILQSSRVVGRLCRPSPKSMTGLQTPFHGFGMPFPQPLHNLHTRLIRFLVRLDFVLRLRRARPSTMQQISSRQRGGKTSLTSVCSHMSCLSQAVLPDGAKKFARLVAEKHYKNISGLIRERTRAWCRKAQGERTLGRAFPSRNQQSCFVSYDEPALRWLGAQTT